MKKTNVAVVTPGIFPIPSYRSSSVEQVVVKVSSLLKEDINFLIFSKKTKRLPFYERKRGISYIRPVYKNRMYYLKKVTKSLSQRNVSIIQVENRPRFAKYFKQRFHKRKVWLCLHSTTYFTQPHISLKELKACLNYVDRIIVNSHFLKEKLLLLVPHTAHKIEINHLGVDPQQFISKWSDEGLNLKAELTRQLGYANKKIILYVGRIIHIKGVHHILKVMPQIIKQYPEAVLVVVGSAFYGKKDLTPYVTHLHQMGNTMPHHVRFIPFVSHNEIHRWFLLADIVVVPSFADEAFGLVNVEAMSSGVPVIATKSGGMREIIEHHKTGFLIDPHNIRQELVCCILDLLSNFEKRKMMGVASIQRVQDHFTWQHTADRFLAVYKRAHP
jgi:spore coat protein SA